MKGLLTTLRIPSDEQIMWRVHADGDAQSFAQLVERWQESIRNVCTRMLGDPHRGEDMAQETFMRLYANRAHYRPLARFSTFIWRIALNLCADELRRRKRRCESLVPVDPEAQEHLVANLPSQDTPPDLNLVQQERGDLVRQALFNLPETYQTVLVLRHYEGLKFREIAEILEIPEGTVKSRMAEAMAQLTRQLTHRLEHHAGSPKPAAPLTPPCRLEIL